VPRLILLSFVRKRRTRPDQTHLALQYVEKLREFIDARRADEAAEASYARVRPQLVERVRRITLVDVGMHSVDQAGHILAVNLVIRIRNHRAELVKDKRLTALA